LVTFVFAARTVLDDHPPEFDVPWLTGTIDIHFSLGLDGLSRWMFGLSALLTITAVLVSWEAIEERAPAFYALLLLLESGMLGVFAARDIILFYIFFEFTLIPLFFLIGIWGSEERRYAAIKFFLFTLAGSLLTFLGLLSIVLWNYFHADPAAEAHVMTFSIARLTEGLAAHPMPASMQWWVFLALFIGFAIKVPLFPLHTWLPLAHVQAPTAGSVILAGILLKIGTYGFLRFSLPMLPEGTVACMPWVLWLSAAGIVYGALVALAQGDIKRLSAYSSVSHLGYCMLGIFALTPTGVQGGVLQMINHGLSTGGLFAVVGMIYERYHTRQISELGGLTRRLPILAFFMLLFTFSSIGLPGLNGFAGEFLILVGMFQRGAAEAPAHLGPQYIAISVLAVFGVVLGAWYMLWLVQRVFFGPLKEPAHAAGSHGHDAASHGHAPAVAAHGHGHDSHGHSDHGHGASSLPPSPIKDLCFREIMALVPLVVLMFWIGLAPSHFLRPMAADLNHTTAAASKAVGTEAPVTAAKSLPVRVALGSAPNSEI
jgi:NADH-quinone oxidoreductase subunit M